MAKVGEDQEPAVAERVNLPVMPDEPAFLRLHAPPVAKFSEIVQPDPARSHRRRGQQRIARLGHH